MNCCYSMYVISMSPIPHKLKQQIINVYSPLVKFNVNNKQKINQKINWRVSDKKTQNYDEYIRLVSESSTLDPRATTVKK